MKFNRYTFSLLIILASFSSLYAQKGGRVPDKPKLEFGVFFGASNYQGDLEENAVNINSTLPGYGILARYNFTNKFSLRFGMDYGTITDADSLATSKWRQERNLSFKTTIFDGYLAAEYYFANWSVAYKTFLSPYVFAGVGTFTFDPKAEFQGTWYDLQPLGTEGQGALAYPDRQPYSLSQIYIPFGGGLRVNLGTNWFISLECRMNKTFTDYLDDVSTTYASPEVLESQHGPIAVILANRSNNTSPGSPFSAGDPRGNPKSDDWYFFTGITICHSFKAKSHCYSF